MDRCQICGEFAKLKDYAGLNACSQCIDYRLYQRAARILDLTLSVAERGPKTYAARQRLALALDGKGTIRITDIRCLEGLSNA